MSMETFWAVSIGAIGAAGLFLVFWVPYSDYKFRKFQREVHQHIEREMLRRPTAKLLDESLGRYIKERSL